MESFGSERSKSLEEYKISPKLKIKEVSQKYKKNCLSMVFDDEKITMNVL